MSRFWSDAGWIAAIVFAWAWAVAHHNARHYERLYRDADAGWLRALDRWSETIEKWATADRARIRSERAP